MKKPALAFIMLFFVHWSFGQDNRILQADKGKLFITATKSNDNKLQVAIFNADWRLDYVEGNTPCHIAKAEGDSVSSIAKHRIGPSAENHHGNAQWTRSFYVDISGSTNVNEILQKVNSEYRNIMHLGDDYKLIKYALPDSAAEYYVHGYKGNNTAAVEVLYLWGAPLRDWSVGFTVSVHDREARKVLSSILCMSPNDTELEVRKIKVGQANLLSIMSYSALFCP
jgi:hypothetical protein